MASCLYPFLRQVQGQISPELAASAAVARAVAAVAHAVVPASPEPAANALAPVVNAPQADPVDAAQVAPRYALRAVAALPAVAVAVVAVPLDG